MKINHEIVLKLEETTGCPILEMFEENGTGRWYVCFEEYTRIEGEDQIVHLDELMEQVEKYDGVEWFDNEVYTDDEREETYFEQVTFQWVE